MDGLFVRPDGLPMQFYLADLDKTTDKRYSSLIQEFGGKVEEVPNDEVLTFTIPSESYKYEFVFHVQFIDDCIEKKTILNVDSYNFNLGDQRHNEHCLTSQHCLKTSQCFYTMISYNKICKSIKNKVSTKHAIIKDSIEVKRNKKRKLMPISKINEFNELDKEKGNEKSSGTHSTGNASNNIKKSDDTQFVEDSPNVLFNTYKNTITKRVRRKGSKFSTQKRITEGNSIIILSSGSEDDPCQEANPAVENSRKVIKEKKKLTQNPFKNKENEINVNEINVPAGYESNETQDKENDSDDETSNKKRSISEELQKFIHATVKDKEVDFFGYPRTFSMNFEPWEYKAMVDFLTVSDIVHLAKDLDTWKTAHKLKFLPRKRSANAMQRCFMRNILPNIEDYNLTTENLVKFNILRPPKKVIDNE